MVLQVSPRSRLEMQDDASSDSAFFAFLPSMAEISGMAVGGTGQSVYYDYQEACITVCFRA